MELGTIAIRLSKVVLTAGIALWTFLVAFGNITDYQTNWAFVQHVMSMDTIFPGSTIAWRALTAPGVQTAAYLVIIAAECLTFFAFFVATIAMVRKLGAPDIAFRRAKSLVAIGVTIAVALWLVGFMAVGGEWFAMWQSST